MKMKKIFVAAFLLTIVCLPAYAIKTEYIDAYAAEPATINCLKSSATQTMRMGYNVLDGLVEFDNYAVLRPCLATSWQSQRMV